MGINPSAFSPFVDTGTHGTRAMPDAAMSSAVREAPARPRGDFKQGLRVRRFLFASAFSMMYLAVLAGFYVYDKVDRTTLLQACALVATFIAAFYCIFRFGLNLRLPDPSLTAWQFLASVFTMTYIVYRAPETRLAFTSFFFVALMFCMLRHSGRKVAVLGAITLLGFELAVWLRYSTTTTPRSACGRSSTIVMA
jgi:hypothetical protein